MVAVWSFALPLPVSRVRWFRVPFSLVRVRRRSLVFGLGRVWCWFWSFASSTAVVSFLLNFGPRLVLVLVVPRGVGFGLSRFALVLVVCGGFVLFSPLIAWCWSSQATK